VSRSTWVAAGLGIAFVVVLLAWMGKTLDVKAPVRIDRGVTPAPPEPPPPTATAEETAEREMGVMRQIVTRRAATLERRAAAQAFPPDEADRVQCSFTAARLVHRDESSAYWDAEFSCVDPLASAALPNPTTVSVRLAKDARGWIVSE
jgi:hypothetical protein